MTFVKHIVFFFLLVSQFFLKYRYPETEQVKPCWLGPKPDLTKSSTSRYFTEYRKQKKEFLTAVGENTTRRYNYVRKSL